MAAIFCLGLNVLMLQNIQFNIEKQYKPVLSHIYIYIYIYIWGLANATQ